MNKITLLCGAGMMQHMMTSSWMPENWTTQHWRQVRWFAFGVGFLVLDEEAVVSPVLASREFDRAERRCELWSLPLRDDGGRSTSVFEF